MTTPSRLLAALALAALLAPLSARAGAEGEVVLKMGTLAPADSPWHLILKDMGEKWRDASGGKVQLKIFAGGVAGDEPDMVRKLRIGQLQAAALTIVGLSLISPEPQALSVPQLLASYEELDHVRDALGPALEAQLAKKGFVVLNWADAGWVRFFTTRPVKTPADLRQLKVFVWTGSPGEIDLWRDAGFVPIPLAATDILPSLQTGLIEAVPMASIVALASQVYKTAPYAVDLEWAPLVGGTVVSAAAWDKVPADLRPRLLAIARATGERLRGEIRKMDVEAVEAMKKRGLTVTAIDPATRDAWRAIAEKAWPRVRSEVVPAQTFDEVRRLRDEFRAGKAAAVAGSGTTPTTTTRTTTTAPGTGTVKGAPAP